MDPVTLFPRYFGACSRRDAHAVLAVQPAQIGPFSLGTGTAVRPARPQTPGVVAVTEPIADNDAAVQGVRELSRRTVVESRESPGFRWFTSAVTRLTAPV